MKALRFDRTGDLSRLRLVETPRPKGRDGAVLASTARAKPIIYFPEAERGDS